MRSSVTSLVVLLAAASAASGQSYTLAMTYNVTNVFDEFEFLNHGLFVDQRKGGPGRYVDAIGSRSHFIVIPNKNTPSQDEFFIGVNFKDVSSYDRPTIHIASKKVFTKGLLVARFKHLPDVACGASSTFSVIGKYRQDRTGVVVSHGMNGVSRDNYLHGFFPHKYKPEECSRNMKLYNQEQCSIADKFFGCEGSRSTLPRAVDGGGVYAIERTKNSIRLYSWRYADAPKDIHTSEPRPETWGPPALDLSNIICDGILEQFDALKMHFAIDMCPQSSVRLAQCLGVTQPVDCSVYTRQNEKHFEKLYWHIQDIRIFDKPLEQPLELTNGVPLTASSSDKVSMKTPLTNSNSEEVMMKTPLTNPSSEEITLKTPLTNSSLEEVTMETSLVDSSSEEVVIRPFLTTSSSNKIVMENFLTNTSSNKVEKDPILTKAILDEDSTESYLTDGALTKKKMIRPNSMVFPGPYREIESYNMTNYLEKFNFFSGRARFTEYLGRQEAREKYLVGSYPSQLRFWVGVDEWMKYKGRERRSSVFLESKKAYKNNLVIGRFHRIPEFRCGARATFSMVGAYGDGIIMYDSSHHHSMLYTSMPERAGRCKATGIDSDFSCNTAIGRYGLSGCLSHYRMTLPSPNIDMFGAVFAVERTDDYIKVFTFEDGYIPLNVDSDSPDPETWGKPLIQLHNGESCDLTRMFSTHKFVLTISFCPPFIPWHSCEASKPYGSCGDFVRREPAAFHDYVFEVTDIRVFKREKRREPTQWYRKYGRIMDA